ncbi:MAG: pyrimidine-nucleoside phosphorylase [Streptococcaceae bacterium]|jgi:pyrimidine-nucleoside phosphorylase|nr:pyrimidine-nucleoside phosphorylase [Streptococcaceae bacterium]
MRFVDLIEKKRNGKELSKQEIDFWIKAYVAGKIPDYQVSALLMAIYFKGMSIKETANLTLAMVDSGQRLDLSQLAGIKVDKHSTGGVGDKVTLVLIPLIASLGIPVAKMSGRGLGHTGGTIDKLESIDGLQVELSIEQFIQQVQEIGLSVVGQSNDLAPADKLLYALRDVTATVESIPLIASSIMSKKIAAGSDAILLDVTVGSGAFMKDLTNARTLAEMMVQLGRNVGRKTIAVLTDMNEPLGLAIGNRLEVLEAVDVLKNKGDVGLTEFILDLAELMIQLAGEEVSRALLRDNLANGQAYQKLVDLVTRQGGSEASLIRPAKIHQTIEIKAKSEGFITKLDALELGKAAMLLGAGRKTKDDLIDYEVGIVLAKKVGDFVKIDDVLLTLYVNQDTAAEVYQLINQAITIGKIQKQAQSIIEVIGL